MGNSVVDGVPFNGVPFIKVSTPLDEPTVEGLRAGQPVLISGVMFVARDQAHLRMREALESGGVLPFDVRGAVVYYAGPAPARPGWACGPIGPTTSGRMDRFTPELLRMGLKGMVGKGRRSEEVKRAIVENKAVYFAAVGGAGALLAKKVVSCDIIGYADLGPEAIYRIEVKEFPAMVVNDMYGGDLFEEGQMRYGSM